MEAYFRLENMVPTQNLASWALFGSFLGVFLLGAVLPAKFGLLTTSRRRSKIKKRCIWRVKIYWCDKAISRYMKKNGQARPRDGKRYACYDTGSSMSIFIEPELAGATLTSRKMRIGQATASHVFYSQYSPGCGVESIFFFSYRAATDCSTTELTPQSWNTRGPIRLLLYKSAYSSVGRAGDCSCLQLISLGRWFDSGCADLFSLLFLTKNISLRNQKKLPLWNLSFSDHTNPVFLRFGVKTGQKMTDRTLV